MKGGYRPGSGRPKGAKGKQRPAALAVVDRDIARAARKSGLDPLEYMLAVMNDEAADVARRDRMAIAAAPFKHARKEPVGQGKREQRDQEAKDAAVGMFAPGSAPKLVVDNGH